jgi:hypothetical protein
MSAARSEVLHEPLGEGGLAFVLFAFLAPSREAPRKLVTAAAIELVIGVCALVHWFVPAPPL